MRILESSTIGKHGDPLLNEDGLFIGQRYLAVVDGVTSKAEYNLWHPSPGVVAKDLLLAALRDLDDGNNPNDKNSLSLGMCYVQQKLDGALRTAYATHPERSERFFVEYPNERLQANAVVYGVREREIWLFGDCSAMVNDRQIPTMKKVDVLLGEVRSFVMMAYGSAVPNTSDPGRQAILPLLRAQSRYANRPGEYGYFVFDGFTMPDWPVTSIPVSQGDEVVLASDGYPYLRRTLAKSEEALATLRREDPQLIHRFRSTKGFLPGSDAFDDRTYLRFIA